MTIGFSDWGRQTVEQGPQVIVVNQVVNAAINTPFAYLAHYPFMNISADTSGLADHYLVQVARANDSGGVVSTGLQKFTLGPGGRSQFQLPALGNWAQLIVTPKAGTDVSPVVIRALAASGGAAKLGLPFTPGPFATFNGAIAAGATQVLAPTSTVPGDAVLAVGANADKPWHAGLFYWDFTTGGLVQFMRLDAILYHNAAVVPVLLPPAPIELDVTNDDVAANTFHVSIVT